MSSDLFLEEARIVLENGVELTNWSEYVIDSDYLTPTDGWSFSFHPDTFDMDAWKAYRELVRPDYKVSIYIGDKLQMTGWIDSVTHNSSSSGGLTVNVQGRDILKVLVKSNIHPDFKIKDRKLIDVVEDVVQMYYTNPPDVIYQIAENRAIAGIASKHQGKRTIAAIQAKLAQVQAHPHEGAFEFLQRNLRPHGIWMWAAADGSLVVGEPDYDQAPSYKIIRNTSEDFNHITVMSASYTHDRTAMPTSITVWGRGVAKEFGKAKLVGRIIDPLARSPNERSGFKEPIYLKHDQAETQDACKAYAWQELSRHREREVVYSCTCVGHSDKRTGNLYNIGTIASVSDDFLGVNEDMFVISRTFRKSSSGTTTDLKMVTRGAITFMDVDTPTTKKQAAAKKKNPAPKQCRWLSAEEEQALKDLRDKGLL